LNPSGGRDFPLPSRPDLAPSQPPIKWVPGHSPGAKRPGRGVNHSPSSGAKVKEREVLYGYCPSAPSWQVLNEKALSSDFGTLYNAIIVYIYIYIYIYIYMYNIFCSDLNTRVTCDVFKIFIYMHHAVDNILMSCYQQTAQQIILIHV
jgi:hypothetical protein